MYYDNRGEATRDRKVGGGNGQLKRNLILSLGLSLRVSSGEYLKKPFQYTILWNAFAQKDEMLRAYISLLNVTDGDGLYLG